MVKRQRYVTKNKNIGIYRIIFKRPMDIFLSLIALIVLSPLIAIIALLARVKLGSPVIFKQDRPGLNEKIFTLYKFRTMSNECDSKGILLPDCTRLTKFGRMLRNTSIDELPEIINILKGDMSIVGPRPLLIQYLPYYNENQKKRHSVKPGLTGLAQINGRTAINWDEKLNYDMEYVRKISFLGDMKIILKTVSTIIKHDDVVNGGEENNIDFRIYVTEKMKIK